MKGILHDVRRCAGCMRCVEACRKENGSGKPDRFRTGDLSAERLTTLAKTKEGRHVRRHCYHCVEPACAAACLVGALTRTPEGPVVYDAEKCIGCRYCMLACPFQVPRYEWESRTPLVKKCDMCADREGGPACVEACPHEATLYGDRDELIRIAHRRIAEHPGEYVDHVWGEKEMGGTGVLLVSDVSLDGFWPEALGETSVPDLTLPLAHKAPLMFGGVLALLTGLSWVIGRRNRLAAEKEGDE